MSGFRDQIFLAMIRFSPKASGVVTVLQFLKYCQGRIWHTLSYCVCGLFLIMDTVSIALRVHCNIMFAKYVKEMVSFEYLPLDTYY